MKNVVKFQNTSSIREEAIAWMSRMDYDDPLTQAEKAELAEWIDRSPAHRNWVNELAGQWGDLNVLTELAVPLSHPTESDRSHTTRNWSLAAVAATLVIAIVAGSLNWPREIPPPDSNGLYATVIGEQESTRLSDGSVLLLNTNTEVRAEYTDEFRDIYLVHGEAHFTVAKNSERPFRVFAGTGRIDAVGTAFSVHLRNDAVDVTVTEGRVALASKSTMPNASAHVLGELKAGQIASIVSLTDADRDLLVPLNNLQDLDVRDLSRRMAWTEGSLAFSGEPLEEVVKEIRRYTTITIEFEDAELGEIPVGGLFPVSEVDTLFRTLESTFGLNVTYVTPSHVLVSAGSR